MVQTCLKLDNSPYLQGKTDTVYGKVVILHEAYINKVDLNQQNWFTKIVRIFFFNKNQNVSLLFPD